MKNHGCGEKNYKYLYDDSMIKVCYYVKDSDDKEYRVAYYQENLSKKNMIYLEKPYKTEYKWEKCLINFYKLYDLIKESSPDVMNYLHNMGYKKDIVDEIITYAFASDHSRGDFTPQLNGVIGFKIDEEYKNNNYEQLASQSKVPSDVIKEMFELYNNFHLLSVSVKKIEKIGNDISFNIAPCVCRYVGVEPNFDLTVFNYKLKEENVILDHNVDKYKNLTYVLVYDKDNKDDCMDFFVEFDDTPKESYQEKIKDFIDSVINEEREYIEPYDGSALFDPIPYSIFDHLYNSMGWCITLNDVKGLLIADEMGGKYPFFRLLEKKDEFNKIEVPFDFSKLRKKK